MDISRSGTARYRRRNLLIAAACAIIAAGGAAYWYWPQASDPARANRTAARAPVPVSVIAATRQDIPVYLTGLGTVQASATV